MTIQSLQARGTRLAQVLFAVQIFPLHRTILPLLLILLMIGIWSADQAGAITPDTPFRWQAALPPEVPEPASLIQTLLPDGGPRFERPQGDPAMERFEQGVAAYEHRDIVKAAARFEAFLQAHPRHEAAPAARAFLVESLLLAPSERPRRMEAIEAYRLLSRDPGAPNNVKRALWRIADLYRELGWYQESEIAYQQALGRADVDSYDASRALVGLGFTLLGMRKWTDAQKTFDLARKHTTDPHVLLHAAIGAGHALYRQGRIAEADASYAASYERWGSGFRRQPYGLIRYAATSLRLKRTQIARRLLMQFYNLYPSRPEAPDALLQVADSYRHAGQAGEAGLFYAAVAARYPETDAGTIARIRLIRLSAERGDEATMHDLPRTLVRSIFLNLPLEQADPGHPAQVLQDIAARHAESEIGSEALFRLAELEEQAGNREEALAVYGRVAARAGRFGEDPWPDLAGARLMVLLQPSLEAAVEAKDDLSAVIVFHRHGPQADRLYAGHRLLPAMADAHARLGFSIEGARLYQSIIRNPQSNAFLEPALIGLGACYLDQDDPQAAQRVFERYRLQFPVGRYATDAFLLLLTSMSRQGAQKSVVRVGRQWLRTHGRDDARKHVLAQIGMALMELQRPDEARRALEEAYRLGGLTTAELLARYGDLLTKANRHQQAIALYRQSLAAGPDRELAGWEQVQIGRNFRDARRPEQARASLAEISAEENPLLWRVATALAEDLGRTSQVERSRP
ncbi:MAG: tetratricopeptide repeat protein [Nitrospiraceae bacterium]